MTIFKTAILPYKYFFTDLKNNLSTKVLIWTILYDDFKKIPQKIKIRAGTNTIDYGSNNSVVMRNIWKQASREQSRTST